METTSSRVAQAMRAFQELTQTNPNVIMMGVVTYNSLALECDETQFLTYEGMYVVNPHIPDDPEELCVMWVPEAFIRCNTYI